MDSQNNQDHERFLRAAIEAAGRAVEHGNHPFGSVLVHNGEIILEAENTVVTELDCTGHAEINLVREACKTIAPQTLQECTLYTSTEPCPMCSAAIVWAGIPTVVFACSSATQARYGGESFRMSAADVFATARISPRVIGPILEDEAAAQHQAFWTHRAGG